MRFAILAVLVACRAEETSVEGPTLYANWCARCHGPEGKPNATVVAQLHVKDLTAPEFRARVTPAIVAHQIRAGSVNQLMPPLAGALSEEQIQAIAKYVASPAFVARSARP